MKTTKSFVGPICTYHIEQVKGKKVVSKIKMSRLLPKNKAAELRRVLFAPEMIGDRKLS